ncbi:MAG: hypothetical protein K2W86_07320, partial [Sphingomonas sp.]|uniref:hypothetical protein n=1 Tax=Sphingomonas sp. TaxID=28214 RepID=UPI0035A917AE|nr:hypothetical protein [Sphingomonas sp.]
GETPSLTPTNYPDQTGHGGQFFNRIGSTAATVPSAKRMSASTHCCPDGRQVTFGHRVLLAAAKAIQLAGIPRSY